MSANVLWKASLCCAVVFICLVISAKVEALDKEDCLKCHKYRFIGRIDENGRAA